MKRQVDQLKWQDIKPGLEICPIGQPEEFDLAALKIGQLMLQHYLEYPPRADHIPVTDSLRSRSTSFSSIALRLDEKGSPEIEEKYKAFVLKSVRVNDANRINNTETRLFAVAGNRGAYRGVESIVYLRLEKPVSDRARFSARNQVGALQEFSSLTGYLQKKRGYYVSSSANSVKQGVDWEDLKLAPELG